MIKKAVIPAAGMGTRLRPLTLAMPKETLPVVDRPAIHHIMETLKYAGIEDVIVVSGYKKHALMDYFSAPEVEITKEMRSLDGLNFQFTTQSKAIGIADAIGRTKNLVGSETFVCIFGDTIIKPSTFLKEMVDEHENLKSVDKKIAATVGVIEVKNVERWGIVKLSGEKIGKCFKVLDMVEKPKKEEAPSNLAIAGCYIFEPVIFEAIEETLKRPPGAKGEYQITDSMRILLERGYSIYAIPLDVAHYDLGTLEDYISTFVELALKDEKFGPIIREKLKEKKIL
jgi:UTP--glucose-1-phosphate uridylyltransferase